MAKNAVATRKSTLPANWEQKMKADAAKGRQQEANVGVSRRLKTKGGVLMYQDTPMPGNKIECVILTASKENAYYEGEYDPENPTSPVCFAFATADVDEKAMAPHEESQKKQHDDCHSCPQNKFGSAEKGRGKACKNTRNLVLIHADALKGKDGLALAETVTASVPPTSLPGWAAFVKTLETNHGLPVYAFVTEISLTPRQQGGFFMNFALLRQLDKKTLNNPDFANKVVAAEQEGAERPPYQVIDAPAPAGKKGAAKGKGGQQAAAQPRRKF